MVSGRRSGLINYLSGQDGRGSLHSHVGQDGLSLFEAFSRENLPTNLTFMDRIRCSNVIQKSQLIEKVMTD